MPITPESGITAAATARVAIDGAAPATVKLVEVQGRYRVVVDVDRGRLASAQPEHASAAASPGGGPVVDVGPRFHAERGYAVTRVEP